MWLAQHPKLAYCLAMGSEFLNEARSFALVVFYVSCVTEPSQDSSTVSKALDEHYSAVQIEFGCRLLWKTLYICSLTYLGGAYRHILPLSVSIEVSS